MTTLAISRVTTVGRMVLQDCQTYKSAAKLGILAGGPILASLVIAVSPILPIFEDYFVNGLYYKHSPLFLGTVNKPRHFKAFEAYFGENSSSWSDESSWGQIRLAVAEMFSREPKGKHNMIRWALRAGTFMEIWWSKFVLVVQMCTSRCSSTSQNALFIGNLPSGNKLESDTGN